MPASDLIAHGAHVLTVCNACRYCEQFCPVFPAIEERRTFDVADLSYLANLCHNCGECLYACQYAPPHEFGIDVPRTLAQLRVRSYEDCCWPAFLGAAFRANSLLTGLGLALGASAVMGAAAAVVNRDALQHAGGGDFYAVVPHGVMVALFGGVFAFVLVALGVGVVRFRRDIAAAEIGDASQARWPAAWQALRDVLTLRHLHATGVDCVSGEERRSPWRRVFHHCTFYGFGLCFASTTVAAVYHTVFGWHAPYGYASLPVLLGTAGGVGLLIGPAGLWRLRRTRDPALGDPSQRGMDDAFTGLLMVTSLTGLVLLALRERPVMGVLLIVHLGAVLALFLTLPYGKFVHGLYRTAALFAYARESRRHDTGRDSGSARGAIGSATARKRAGTT